MNRWLAFDEVEKGEITDASFVANIWRVYKNEKDIDERYRDPEKFFERTFVSEGLENVLKTALSRVFEGKGEPVILLRTTFGGGKTHTLIAIYHALQNRDIVAKYIKVPEADVHPFFVAFDGRELDPQRMRDHYGANSLWQFLFNEIVKKSGLEDFKKICKDYANPKSPPGTEVIREALKKLENAGTPIIFLLDEVPDYIDKLHLRSKEEATATIHFLDALASAVSQCSRSLLVLTIPEVRMLSNINEEIVNILAQRVGRVAIPRNIVGKEDAAHVLIRALIKDFNPTESNKEVDAFYKIYVDEKKNFPANVSTTDYLEKMRAYYPFHPQYIEVLYDKIANLETFQSTRDILRLTAHVLHNLCRKNDRRLVLLSDINMAEKSIVDEFLDRHGFGNLRRAIEVDLEVIKKLDEECVRRKLPALFTPVYSSIAVYSVAGEPVSVKDIMLATVRPDLHPNHILGVLEQMMESDVAYVYKLSVDGETRYIIKEKISWVRLVDIKSRDVSDEDAKQELESRFKEAFKSWGKSIFSRVIQLVQSPKDVKDDASLTLVLLDPSAIEKDEEETLNYFTIYSDPARQELRKFRNSVMYVLPDLNVYRKSLDIARKVIAALRIKDAKETYGLSEDDIEAINKQINKWRNELRDRAAAVYNRLAYPIGGKDGGIKFEIKALNHTNPVKASAELLERESKVIKDISEAYLLRLIKEYYSAMGESAELKVKDLAEFFARDPDKPYVLSAKAVISSKVSKLVDDGKVVVVRGDNVYAYQSVKVREDDLVLSGEIAEKRGLCIEYEGKYIPKPPKDISEVVWDEKSRKWVEKERKEEVEEEKEEIKPKPKPELDIIKEPETAKPEKLELENTNLPELVEVIKDKKGKFLSFEISGSAHKDASDTINFLKSLSVQLKKFNPEFSISAEVGDGDSINLRVSGDVKADGIKDVLLTLERLGCRSIRYEIEIRDVNAEKLFESLDSKLLKEKYRKERFSVSGRIKS